MNERLLRLYHENRKALTTGLGILGFVALSTVPVLTPRSIDSGFDLSFNNSPEKPVIVVPESPKPTPTSIVHLPAELRTLVMTNPEMQDLMVFISNKGGDLTVDDYGESGATFEVDMPQMGLGLRELPFTPFTDGEVVSNQFLLDRSTFKARYGIRVAVPDQLEEESLVVFLDKHTHQLVDLPKNNGSERFVPTYIPSKIGNDSFVKLQTVSNQPVSYQLR